MVGRELQQTTGGPVVFVIAHRLKNITPNKVYTEGYNWRFVASEDQIREFLTATKLIAEFGPAWSDETYDVYLLRRDPQPNR